MMGKKLWSVFTDDMEHCYYTESPLCERHHIFYGAQKKKSEKYGYIMPLAHHLHKFKKGSVHDSPNKGLDLELKRKAYNHFLENHGTQDDFIAEFDRAYEE